MLLFTSLFGYFCSIFLHLNVKDLNYGQWSLRHHLILFGQSLNGSLMTCSPFDVSRVQCT